MLATVLENVQLSVTIVVIACVPCSNELLIKVILIKIEIEGWVNLLIEQDKRICTRLHCTFSFETAKCDAHKYGLHQCDNNISAAMR